MASTVYVSTWPTDPRAFESLFEATPSAIFALDRAGRIVGANTSASLLTGYSQEELLELDISQLAQDSVQFIGDAFASAEKREASMAEMDFKRHDGSLVPVQVTTIPVLNGRHAGFLFFQVDEAHYLTEMRRTRAHMRTLAYYDSLTGLPNRIFFQERLRDALEDTTERRGCIALMFLDLDRFKDLNDTLGHALGDRFLQLFGERLVLLVKNRGIVARLGGDEFVVLLTKCSGNEEARDIAAEIIQSAERPYRIDGYEQYVTASIGIAMFPAHGRTDQALIKNADIAMYRAKEQGRNAYFFYDEALEAPIRNRLAQEHDLRRALKNGEFGLQYQPILEAGAGNRVVGVEALVRWNHPSEGLLPPDVFIPAAEASGLIVPLGEWVLRTAAEQMHAWQQRYGPLLLAINMSARQFHQRDLCDRLLTIVTDAGLQPSSIEVEITESMALFDAENALETIRGLKRIGAKIAIDDFGTGHSSLGYLKRLPVDELKIDQAFVVNLGPQGSAGMRTDRMIVRSVTALAHALGLQVVAEGVENWQTYELLAALRCNVGQGYYLSRPMPVSDVAQWVRTTEFSPAASR